MEVKTNKIKSFVAKYPELTGTEDNVLSIYERLDDVESKIWELRQQIYELEKQKKELSDKWKSLSNLYDIEYETKVVKEIKNTTNMQIINDSDYRNHD